MKASHGQDSMEEKPETGHAMPIQRIQANVTESNSPEVTHERGSYQGSFICVLYKGIARSTRTHMK